MRERRSSPRYLANMTIDLRWETGEVLQARLEDFSVGGALVRVDAPPPRDRKVSVCVHDGERRLSVDGTILEVRKLGGWIRRASFALRIKFSESCSWDFFRDNVFAWVPPPVSPEYESYWR